MLRTTVWNAVASLCLLCLGFTSLAAAQDWREQSAKVGVGLRFSTLGGGAEVAIPVTPRSNLRGGFNVFRLGHDFSYDDIPYNAQINLTSVDAHYDFFPFHGGFHVSPGLLIYNGNKVTATSRINGGDTFTLGDTDYVSDPNNNFRTNAGFGFNKVAPTFVVGFGNLVSRNRRSRITFLSDFGFAYAGDPDVRLDVGGGVCRLGFCQDVAKDPGAQADAQLERRKIADKVSPARFYPIISVGVGFSF